MLGFLPLNASAFNDIEQALAADPRRGIVTIVVRATPQTEINEIIPQIFVRQRPNIIDVEEYTPMTDVVSDQIVSTLDIGGGGTSWEGYTVPFVDEYTTAVASCFANGKYLVGGDNGELAISNSANAESWNLVSPGVGTERIRSIAHNGLPDGQGGLFGLVTQQGSLAKSPDGYNWEKLPGNFGDLRGLTHNKVPGNGGWWVAVGRNPGSADPNLDPGESNCWRSQDFTTWIRPTTTLTFSGSGRPANDVEFGAGRFVAAGGSFTNNAEIGVSEDDGDNWTMRTIATAPGLSNDSTTFYAPDRVWVGTGGAVKKQGVFRSTDETATEFELFDITPLDDGISRYPNQIRGDNSTILIIVGSGGPTPRHGLLLTSSDGGKNWVQRDLSNVLPSNSIIYSITHNGFYQNKGRFLATAIDRWNLIS